MFFTFLLEINTIHLIHALVVTMERYNAGTKLLFSKKNLPKKVVISYDFRPPGRPYNGTTADVRPAMLSTT